MVRRNFFQPLKPLDAFPFVRDQLHVDACSVSEIIESVGTPAYLYSERALQSSFERFATALAKHLPDALVCYAVKANSNLAILQCFQNWGAGFDLVSGGELERVRRIGGNPSNVVFSGVGKTEDDMRMALHWGPNGIYSFNVESTEETKVLAEIAASCGKVARIALRVNPNVNAKTHPYISTGLRKNKFGLTPDEIFALAAWLKRTPSIRVAGLSMHIGSQILSARPFEDAFKRMAQIAREFESALGHRLEFIDVGGGIGVPYKSETTPSLEKYVSWASQILGPNGLGYRLLFEPGRSLTANAGILISRVLFRKIRKDKHFLIVDAGMNDLMRPALYGSFHGIVPVQRKRSGLRPFDVVGPVCESSDCFAQERPLPSNLQRGDLIAFLSAGAYGFSMANSYNTRPRPVEILVQENRYRVIRKRESTESLFQDELDAIQK
jgi:diaminopimelate decarboxylase